MSFACFSFLLRSAAAPQPPRGGSVSNARTCKDGLTLRAPNGSHANLRAATACQRQSGATAAACAAAAAQLSMSAGVTPAHR